MRDLPAAVPAPLVAVWVAVVGAVVGSFLNVVIARVPAGESVVQPGSRCPSCRTPIRWYDNLPVLSWVVLRARCRACGERISVRYPIIELLGGLAALGAWWRHGLSPAALGEFTFAAMLVALAAIDLDTWLLPHALTWPLIALGLVASGVHAAAAPTLLSSLFGAAVGFALFGLVHLVGEKLLHREAMGLGDVFLLAGIGAWLGLSALLPVILLASLQGSVVGLVLLAMGKGQPGPPPAPSAEPPPPAQPPAIDSTVGLPTPDQAAAQPAPVELPPPDPAASGQPSSLETEPEWIPPRHSVPFGPFLAAGALEWLYLAALLWRHFPVLKLFR